MKRRAITLRIPEETAEKLEFVAKVAGSTVTATVVQAIEEHVDGLVRSSEQFRSDAEALLQRHQSILAG